MLNKPCFIELMRKIDFSLTKKELIEVLINENALQSLISDYNIYPSSNLRLALQRRYKSLSFGYDKDFELINAAFSTFNLKGVKRYDEIKNLLPFKLEISDNSLKALLSTYDKVFKAIKKINPTFDFSSNTFNDEDLL